MPSLKRARVARAADMFAVEALEERRLLSVGHHHHHHHTTAKSAASASVLKLGAVVDATKLAGSEMEAQVAVNPVNAKNLVIVSQSDVNHGNAIPVTRSFDGGASWGTIYIDGNADGYGATPRPDARAVFDAFGNLYIVYMVASSRSEVRLNLFHSSNGGWSFDRVTSPVASVNIDPDNPLVATGPDASNLKHQALWITYTDYKSNRVMAVAATSTGLGQLSAFSAPKTVSGRFGAYASVAVGPKGEVAVAWENTDSGQGPAGLYMNVDAKGLAGAFGKDQPLLTTNVGGWDYIPAQPNRSIDAEPKLAFDRSGDKTTGRLYLAWTDENVNESNDTDIELKYTDNLGGVWSDPVRVNDDATRNSQFLPALAVDQTTGNVGLSWYDSRNSADNTGAQLFATVSLDHGASVEANVQVAAGMSNQAKANPSPNDLDFGDVNSVGFNGGRLVAVWSDNSGQATFDVDAEGITVV